MLRRQPLAVSLGEPAGIGPDLILRLYAERASLGLPPFIVFGHLGFLNERAARLGLGVELMEVAAGDADAFETALPVVQVEGLAPDHPGNPSSVSATLVRNAIERATAAVLSGECRAIVTGPIHKATLARAGFGYPGHTEYIAALCSGNPVHEPVMMLLHDEFRVVPLTIHVPLAQVPPLITANLVISTVRTVRHDLHTRFGIAEPRLAVAGLNPHAGEAGQIGMEELDIIGPAIAQLRHEGLNVEGPTAADSLFHPPHWLQYDAVIAMYHDQALIPIKTVAFETAVNITLGLPIVRTSPDHGTAFDLAGTGEGSTASFLAAIRLADKLTPERH